MPKIATRRVPPQAYRVGKTEIHPSVAVPRSLTAAGQPITSTSGGGVSSSGTGGGDTSWAQQGWGFFDTVGELRYVCAWLSNALSRCSIMASDVDPDTGQPTGSTEDVMAKDTVRDIAGGPAGQAALFGRMATYFTVPGDMYVAIIIRDAATAGEEGADTEEWYVLSTEEVKRSAQKVELILPDGRKHEMVDENDTLFRVHRPHPRKAQEADSPVRAAIPILREIVRLGQHVESTAKSRLSGNGIVLLPQELSMPVAAAPTGELPVDPDAPGLPTPDGGLPAPSAGTPEGAQDSGGMVTRSVTANDVMQALITAGATAVDDPSSAAATVPIILQAPGEFLDKIKHLTMGTEFTEVVMKLREAATKRLALSLDVPAEILLGTGDMNHWSAWQMEESAIKLHVEPLMVMIVDALTEFVLRPMLKLQGHPDPESVVIWYDTTGLAMRPNRSQDAKDAHDRGLLSGRATVEYLGFTDADMFDPDDPAQLKSFVISLVLKNGALLSDPVIASILGIELPEPPPAETPAPGETPPAEDETPIPAQPEGEEPDVAARVAYTEATALASVQRALALAGNRLRTRGNLSSLTNVPRHDTAAALGLKVDRNRVPSLIAGWQETLTPETLSRARADFTKLSALVEHKATDVLTKGHRISHVHFTPEELRSVLR